VQICTHPGVKNDPDNNTSINNININNMGKKSSKLLREKSDDSDFFELSVEEKTKKVEEYCKEKNYTIDVDYFVDYYETTNWHQRNGKKVVNWKLAVCSWANKSYNKNQKNDSSSPSRLAKPQDDYVHYEQVSDYDYVDNIFKEKGITEKEFYDKIEQWKISVYNETGEFVIGNPPDDIIRKILNKEI
jgi:hypothetical protein